MVGMMMGSRGAMKGSRRAKDLAMSLQEVIAVVIRMIHRLLHYPRSGRRPLVRFVGQKGKKAFLGQLILWPDFLPFFCRWPAYIYNPSRLNAKLRSKAIPVAGKKHTVLYFGSKDFGFVPPSQIKFPFDDFKEEFSKQTITKKYLGWFQQAIPDAEAELAKPKEDRMFIERPRRKRKSTSSSKKKTPTALKKKTPAKKKDTKEEDKDGKVEPEDEDDDQNEEQDEDEDEEEVVSEDESEAEFEDSPKKKSKAPAKEKKSDKPKKSEKATTPRPEKPRKSEASQSEDVPKKKVGFVPGIDVDIHAEETFDRW